LVDFFKGKKEIVDYLKAKEGDGFEWTSLVTGAFFDWVCYLLSSLTSLASNNQL
jgi:hypothetical protein